MPKAKAQTKPAKYLQSTVQIVDGISKQGKPRPFNYDAAIKQFGSWAYRAGMINAGAFASQTLRLYVKSKGGRKFYRTSGVPRNRKSYLCGEQSQRPSVSVMRKVAEFGSDFEEVTEPHPAMQVLSQVNPWQNGFELSVLRALFWQFTGNAYLHPIIGPLGVPSELWLMPSQWMRIIPSKQTFISGYVYGRKPDERHFAPDEVGHWKLPNMADPYYGMGWVEALWPALALHNSKRTMDIAKFDNMARPDWLLVVKSGAGAEALDRLDASIQAKLQGKGKSGNFLSVTGDVEAIPLNFDTIEIGDPEVVISEIAAVAGCPLHKLLGNDPVKANSENSDVGWLRDTIAPMCRMDEEQLNAWYLPMFGIQDDAVLAYDNPVPDNKVEATDIALKEVGGPWKTVNEHRAAEGLEPIEGGDMLRNIAVDPVAMAEIAATKPLPVKSQKKSRRIGNVGPNGTARALPDGTEIAVKVRQVFDAQMAEVIAGIDKHMKAQPGDADKLPPLVGLEKWDTTLSKEVAPTIEAIMAKEGKNLLLRVNPTPSVLAVFEKNIPQAAREATMRFAHSTNVTTAMELEAAKEMLRMEITDGLIEGDTRNELIKRVQDIFHKGNTVRAEMIAQTEASRAAHTGELMGAKESGVVSRKFWLLSADACPVCQEIHTEHPDGLPLDKTFAEFGGEYGSIAGPPGHVNCQCSLIYGTTDDGSRP